MISPPLGLVGLNRCPTGPRSSAERRRASPALLTQPLIILLLVVLGTSTSGCFTNHVVEWKAKSHREFDPVQGQDVSVAGKPGYYALVPLTVPLDIVTSPIQFGILLAWPAAHAPATPGATNPCPLTSP